MLSLIHKTCLHIYIYIYIYVSLSLSLYIYIYVYAYIYIYIYIYINESQQMIRDPDPNYGSRGDWPNLSMGTTLTFELTYLLNSALKTNRTSTSIDIDK